MYVITSEVVKRKKSHFEKKLTINLSQFYD